MWGTDTHEANIHTCEIKVNIYFGCKGGSVVQRANPYGLSTLSEAVPSDPGDVWNKAHLVSYK